MTWIPVFDDVTRHEKTRSAAADLRITRHQLVGHLVALWGWAIDKAPEGGPLHEDDVARAAEWDRKHAPFVKALVQVGMLERDDEGMLWIHDWEDGGGRLHTGRKLGARRQSLHRDTALKDAVRARDGDECRYCGLTVRWTDRRGPGGGTYDHIDPDGENVVENIAVCCRSCNSKKKDRTPEESGMYLLPIKSGSRSVPKSDSPHRETEIENESESEKEIDQDLPDPSIPLILPQPDRAEVNRALSNLGVMDPQRYEGIEWADYWLSKLPLRDVINAIDETGNRGIRLGGIVSYASKILEGYVEERAAGREPGYLRRQQKLPQYKPADPTSPYDRVTVSHYEGAS